MSLEHTPLYVSAKGNYSYSNNGDAYFIWLENNDSTDGTWDKDRECFIHLIWSAVPRPTTPSQIKAYEDGEATKEDIEAELWADYLFHRFNYRSSVGFKVVSELMKKLNMNSGLSERHKFETWWNQKYGVWTSPDDFDPANGLEIARRKAAWEAWMARVVDDTGWNLTQPGLEAYSRHHRE